MHLIELLLPLYDNTGAALPRDRFLAVRAELTERFGGLTAFTRAPAEGLWKDDGERTQRDDIVIYEVMVESIDREWWGGYRTRLEKQFRQERIIIRATRTDLL
jgi:hypothetical protein